jgi:hypothetical protein
VHPPHKNCVDVNDARDMIMRRTTPMMEEAVKYQIWNEKAQMEWRENDEVAVRMLSYDYRSLLDAINAVYTFMLSSDDYRDLAEDGLQQKVVFEHAGEEEVKVTMSAEGQNDNVMWIRRKP